MCIVARSSGSKSSAPDTHNATGTHQLANQRMHGGTVLPDGQTAVGARLRAGRDALRREVAGSRVARPRPPVGVRDRPARSTTLMPGHEETLSRAEASLARRI